MHTEGAGRSPCEAVVPLRRVQGLPKALNASAQDHATADKQQKQHHALQLLRMYNPDEGAGEF